MNRSTIQNAQLAIEQFGDDEDELYGELGKRLAAIAKSPAGSDSFDMAADLPIETYGASDELKKLGRRFFLRWNQAAFDLMCGSSAEDADARNEIAQAFNLGPAAISATIAALLVTHVGMAAALAAVVATLAVKLFFKPGYEAMCDSWKDKLPPPM